MIFESKPERIKEKEPYQTLMKQLITEGQIIKSLLFNEPMRVETVRTDTSGILTVGMVGTQTECFRRVILVPEDTAGLTILNELYAYNSDGKMLRLGIQAHSLGIAYVFDLYFGLSISRVDPLPHQLEAVCDYFLKLPYNNKTAKKKENEKDFGINLRLDETQNKIVKLMIANMETTAEQIAETIGITKRQIEANISKLKALGIVERIGARQERPVGCQVEKMSG